MPRANTNSKNAYNRSYQAIRQNALKADGVCVKCGNRPGKPSTRSPKGIANLCVECGDKVNSKNAAKLRGLRESWSALGLCLLCGVREAILIPGTNRHETRRAPCAEVQDDYKERRRSS